jgi:hypothetical protein
VKALGVYGKAPEILNLAAVGDLVPTIKWQGREINHSYHLMHGLRMRGALPPTHVVYLNAFAGYVTALSVNRLNICGQWDDDKLNRIWKDSLRSTFLAFA